MTFAEPKHNKASKSKTFFNPSGRNGTGQPFFQAKLTVGPANDQYEREADATADKIMRMSNGDEEMAQPKISSLKVQRKCAECEEEERENRAQRKAKPGETEEATDEVHYAISSMGQPIDKDTRSFMESRFGYDFSDVKIHADQLAAKSAKSVNALAYTSGNDIVFNKGQYSPGTESGKRLLAHELTHVVQQGRTSKTVQRFRFGEHTHIQKQDSTTKQSACTTTYHAATTFQELIVLVRAAEVKLSAAGIPSTRDQIHALRGIYYGTTWSHDFAEQRSTTRNEGFQLFTRPSAADPNTTVPVDIRTILDCGLFNALQNSQDMTDGSRHIDFGHLIIGLDARFDPSFNANVQYSNPIPLMPSIDLGGTGVELVTWLGDLGGGASSLATRRVTSPGISASVVFRGTDYGGSINLEGDIAAFVVATRGTPTSPQAPTFPVGSSRLSDALQSYLTPGSVSTAWTGRATTFLRMYGATFDASNNVTNSATLIANFQTKIATFACNYLASRVKDHHITFQRARLAAGYINNASQEVATTFVDALVDSHTTGNRIEATRFPTPIAGTSTACLVQIAAGSVLGGF